MRKACFFLCIVFAVQLSAAGVTVSKTANQVGTQYNWTNGQAYSSFMLGDRVTFAVKQSAEGKQNGYYWNDQTLSDWRIYQARNQGEFSVSVPSGYVIRTLALEYYSTKQGVLSRVAGQQVAEENQIASGAAIQVDSSSITLYAANMMDSAAGQVRLTRFTVTYSYADTTSYIEGFSKVTQTQNNEKETTWEGDVCDWKALRVRRSAKDTLNGGIQATWFNQNGYLQSASLEGGVKHLHFTWREFVTTVEDLKLGISAGSSWKDTVVMTSSGSFPTSMDWYYDKDIQCKENGQLQLINISDTVTHRFLVGDLFITPYLYFPQANRDITVSQTRGSYDVASLLVNNTDGEGEVVYSIVSDQTQVATVSGSVVSFGDATEPGDIVVRASWNEGKVYSETTIHVLVVPTGEPFIETFSRCNKTQMETTTFIVGDEGVFGWNVTNFTRQADDTIMGVQGIRLFHNGSLAMNGIQPGGVKTFGFDFRAVSSGMPVSFSVWADGVEYPVKYTAAEASGKVLSYSFPSSIKHNTTFSVVMGAKATPEQSEIVVGPVAIIPYLLFSRYRDTILLSETTTYELAPVLIDNTSAAESVSYSILSDEMGTASLEDGVLTFNDATQNNQVVVQAASGDVTTTMIICGRVDATGWKQVQNDESTGYKAQKVMIDNQLYILKNGVRYTVLGAQ